MVFPNSLGFRWNNIAKCAKYKLKKKRKERKRERKKRKKKEGRGREEEKEKKAIYTKHTKVIFWY